MVETHESVEEIEILLERARGSLASFEDGVDYRRLLERLRTASPAHPVLLARFTFGFLAVVCLIAGIVILVVPMLDADLARTLVSFEAVIPYVPDGVPALPAVFAVLAMCWFVGWAMCTGAALAIGREAHLLPWEQRQHQQLVNEVTRLTTQRAVIERIRNTPVSSRPRIATPSMLSMRSPGPAGRSDDASGFSRSPAPSYVAPPPAAAPGGAAGPPGGWTPSGFQRPTFSVTPPPGAGPSYGTPAGAPAPAPYQTPDHGPPAALGPAVGGPAPAMAHPGGPTGTPPFNARAEPPGPGREPWETPARPPLYRPPPAPEGAAETEQGPPPALLSAAVGASPASPPFTEPTVTPLMDESMVPPAQPRSGMHLQAIVPGVEAPGPPPPLPLPADGDEEPTTIRAAEPPRAPVQPAPPPLPSIVPAEVVSVHGTQPTSPAEPSVPPMYGSDADDDVPTAVRSPTPADRSASSPAPSALRPRRVIVDPSATLPPPPEDATTRRTARLPAPSAPPLPAPPPAAPASPPPVAMSGPAVTPGHAPRPAPPAATPAPRPGPAATPGHGATPGRAVAGPTTPSRPAAPPPTRPTPPRAPAVVPPTLAAPRTTPAPPAQADNGILARARAGATGARSTPHGSAGRIRPVDDRSGDASASGPPASVRARRRKGQQITPFGAPDTRPSARLPPRRKRSHQTILEDEDDAPTVLSTLVDRVDEDSDVTPGVVQAVPDAAKIPDQWLRDAVTKAEHLGQTFPVQAQLAYSREPNLPFTLLINRATPAMAVRAMVNFVEFLAGIYTPPRARIELHGVQHLDKSFHRNVVAALEPYFGNNVIVEPSGGMVDIRFTDPDPGWGQYPTLPLR